MQSQSLVNLQNMAFGSKEVRMVIFVGMVCGMVIFVGINIVNKNITSIIYIIFIDFLN